MAKFLRLSNGVPRSFDEASSVTIYDKSIEIVSSGTPPGSLTGPVSAGTPITLPSSGVYTIASGVSNMNIFLNGDRLENVYDWLTSGSGPNYTAFTLTFDLVTGDRLDIRIERNS